MTIGSTGDKWTNKNHYKNKIEEENQNEINEEKDEYDEEVRIICS